MKAKNRDGRIAFGMHVVDRYEDADVALPGDPDPYGPESFRRLLEKICVPQDKSSINTPDCKGEQQLINYSRTKVNVEFAELCVGDIRVFNPFIAYPYADYEIKQEAFLLDPFGKPIGYVGPAQPQCTLDRILALPDPKLLKYILWLEEEARKRPRATLYTIWGNKCFNKLLRWLGKSAYEHARCEDLRNLIEKRNAS